MSNKIILKKIISNFNKKISIPSDKSISIRWVLIASLANGVSKAKNLLISEDVLAAIKAIRKLGIKSEIKDSECKIYGKNGFLTIFDKGSHVLIEIYPRDKEEIKKDPRVTRTGFGLKIKNNIQHYDLSNTFENMILSLYKANFAHTISRETLATKGILTALISSEEKREVNFPTVDNRFFDKEWPVS